MQYLQNGKHLSQLQMKRRLFLLFILLIPFISSANNHINDKEGAEQARAVVRGDRTMAAGLDRVYNPPAKTVSAPKGWETFYVSHYGRHGSRYAYSGNTYKEFYNTLDKGDAEGNLTEEGKKALARMEKVYEYTRYRVGDLTRKGWEQHQAIAARMVSANKNAFKGGRIDAVASGSVRSILSMSSFCLKVGRMAPKADIYEHQGIHEIQATAPNSGHNPLALEGIKTKSPYPVSETEMFYTIMPDHTGILGRFFKDPGKVSGYIRKDGQDDKRRMFEFFIYLYMLEAGQNSLDSVPEFPKIFTDDEFARMWEVDNFHRFNEYIGYKTPCCSVWLDMVRKADERISSGEKGADLRFGHDHVLMTLLMIADIEGFDEFPADARDLPAAFRTFRSPMAGNIQMIFYRKKGQMNPQANDIRVRLLLNEEPSSFFPLEQDGDGLYRWNDLKAYLLSACGKYVGSGS